MSVDLLGGLTVQTYLNGALQESAGAGSLLNLSLFGGTPEKRTIGFTTTQPFDEVRVPPTHWLVWPLISMFTMDCWHRPVVYLTRRRQSHRSVRRPRTMAAQLLTSRWTLAKM
ncbi:MAG: hypothetical protein R2867_43810 [Caldilineaceae bacterium]